MMSNKNKEELLKEICKYGDLSYRHGEAASKCEYDNNLLEYIKEAEQRVAQLKKIIALVNEINSKLV